MTPDPPPSRHKSRFQYDMMGSPLPNTSSKSRHHHHRNQVSSSSSPTDPSSSMNETISSDEANSNDATTAISHSHQYQHGIMPPLMPSWVQLQRCRQRLLGIYHTYQQQHSASGNHTDGLHAMVSDEENGNALQEADDKEKKTASSAGKLHFPAPPLITYETIQRGVIPSSCICEQCLVLSVRSNSSAGGNFHIGGNDASVGGGEDVVIQCLSCASLHCKRHFRRHYLSMHEQDSTGPDGNDSVSSSSKQCCSQYLGLELRSMRYYCAICDVFFALGVLKGKQQTTQRDSSPNLANDTRADTTTQDHSGGTHSSRSQSSRRRKRPYEFDTSDVQQQNDQQQTNQEFESPPFRGLINMGNTCFMNSVLQALIHNPMLRNYMLAFAVPLLQDQSTRCENVLNLLMEEEKELKKAQKYSQEESDTAASNQDSHESSAIQQNAFESSKIAQSADKPLLQSDSTEQLFNSNTSADDSNDAYPQKIRIVKRIGVTPQRKRRKVVRKHKSNTQRDSRMLTLARLTQDRNMQPHFESAHEMLSELHQAIQRHSTKFPNHFVKNHITIGTELQNLIQQCYSLKEHEPIIPRDFVYVVWKSARHLAGYRQQDAHEFLMAVLNGLSMSPPYSSVADFIFKGKLESRLQCGRCRYSSSTEDPFMDISLPLKTHSYQSEQGTNEQETFSSISECLQRYTRPELLDNEYKCPQCSSPGSCTKSLSFKKLPFVLCLHLKRFETHMLYANMANTSSRRGKSSSGGPTKIDDYVDFPLEFDLFPFTSQHLHDGVETCKYDTRYELFAVVEHFGGMNSGHYICYVKRDDQWHLCDDETIRSSSASQVEKSRAYMLFYIQKELQYESAGEGEEG